MESRKAAAIRTISLVGTHQQVVDVVNKRMDRSLTVAAIGGWAKYGIPSAYIELMAELSQQKKHQVRPDLRAPK